MKKIILLITVLSISLLASALDLPSIHSSIMLDAKFYSDTGNNGQYDTSDRFQIRKAALHFTGTIDEHTTYGIELGVSTCTGTGDTFRLSEAEIMREFNKYLSAGIRQGHVMRGFCFYTECTQRLTMEKPWFQQTFAACHPLGLVAEGYFELPANSGIQYQAAILNGVNSTCDQEHDYTLGLMYDSPLPGLAVSASYSHTAANYYDLVSGGTYSEDGFRWGCGAEFQNNGIWITSEYYAGKGFSFDDQEMTALYAQCGYEFPVSSSYLQSIVPWAKYELWDKDSATDDESEYTYFDAGLNFHLSTHTMLKVAYSELIDKPDSALQTPHSLIFRLQTDF